MRAGQKQKECLSPLCSIKGLVLALIKGLYYTTAIIIILLLGICIVLVSIPIVILTVTIHYIHLLTTHTKYNTLRKVHYGIKSMMCRMIDRIKRFNNAVHEILWGTR